MNVHHWEEGPCRGKHSAWFEADQKHLFKSQPSQCLWNFILGYFRFIDYLFKRFKSLQTCFYLIHLCCACFVFRGILRRPHCIRNLAPSMVMGWDVEPGRLISDTGHELASEEGFVFSLNSSNIWIRAGHIWQAVWPWNCKRNPLLWWKGLMQNRKAVSGPVSQKDKAKCSDHEDGISASACW